MLKSSGLVLEERTSVTAFKIAPPYHKFFPLCGAIEDNLNFGQFFNYQWRSQWRCLKESGLERWIEVHLVLPRSGDRIKHQFVGGLENWKRKIWYYAILNLIKKT